MGVMSTEHKDLLKIARKKYWDDVNHKLAEYPSLVVKISQLEAQLKDLQNKLMSIK